MKFKSEVQLEALNNATVDTDKFLVSDSSTVKYRTGAQVLSDIGGQAALTNPITGTGTTNYLSKFTGTTSLGNSQIFDNGTNVGIGITNPVSKLDLGTSGALRVTQAGITEVYVEGTGVRLKNIYPSGGWARGILTYENSTGTDYFQLGGYGSGQTFIYGYLGASYDNNALRWYPNNNVYVGGNLGVGTTNMGGVLNIAGASSDSWASANGGLTLNGNTSGGVSTITTFLDASSIRIGAGTTQKTGIFITGQSSANGSTIQFSTGASERMRIASTGNVGIGITAPSSKLHVYNNDTGIGTDTGITIEQAGTGNAILQYLQTGVYRWVTGIDNSDGDKFKIGRGQSWSIGQDLTIDTSGNVGIGTSISQNYSNLKTLSIGGALGSVIDFQSAAVGSGYNRVAQIYGGDGGFMSLGTGDNNVISERMRITSSGNVGIGTTNPTFSAGSGLQVVRSDYANVRVTGGSSIGMDLLQSSDGTGYLRNRDNAQLRLGTNNVDVITMTNGGNVGIGTTNPDVKLYVDGGDLRVRKYATGLGGRIIVSNATEAGGNYSMYAFGNTASSATYLKGGIAYETLSSTNGRGNMHFLQNSAGNSTNATLADSVMTILNTGNVGIGTTSPQSPLQVGNYTFSGGYARGTVATFAGAWSSTLPTLTLISTDTTSTQNKGGSIAFAGGSEASSTPYTFAQIKGLKELTGGTYSGYMGFYTTPAGSNQNTERMRITSTGNVGIGTTNPTQKLEVGGNTRIIGESILGSTSGLAIIRGDNSNAGTGGAIKISSSNVAANQYIAFGSGLSGTGAFTERMRVLSTGNVGIGTTSPSQKLHVVGNAIVTGSANIQSDLDVGGDTIMTGKVSVTAVGPQEISAALEVTSTTQGFLPPRMKEGERDSISSPATGLMIFNTDSFTVEVFDGSDWRSLAWV